MVAPRRPRSYIAIHNADGNRGSMDGGAGDVVDLAKGDGEEGGAREGRVPEEGQREQQQGEQHQGEQDGATGGDGMDVGGEDRDG